jgi:hypothetical protein
MKNKTKKFFNPEIQEVVESHELKTKLINAEAEIQEFIAALKSEIFNLQEKNIKLEAKNISLQSRLKIFENEQSKRIEHEASINSMSVKELEKVIKNELEKDK